MDIDSLFKGTKVPTGGNKRKMPANPTPEMLKRMKITDEPSSSANGGTAEPTRRTSRPVTVRDEDEDEAEDNFAPGGDADYFVEEDDEGGRFFGGGLTDEQKKILNIFDRAGGEGAQDEEASELNAVGIRRLLSKLEKAVAKNQDQRSKYPNAPEKFIDSEADLDAAIKALLPLAQVPTLSYPELIKSGAIAFRSHPRVYGRRCWGEDEEEEEEEEGLEGGKKEEALKALIESLVSNQTLELLVQNLARMDEKEETDRQGVFHTLGIFENVLGSRPALAETLVSTTTIVAWLLNRILQKEHDDNRGYAAEILSILVQSSRSNRLVLCKADGVDIMLRVLSVFRRRDPASADETEFMENVFDALCSSLAEPEVKELFQKAEGVDLMVLIMKENRASKSRAIKVLDYALAGPPGAANCVTFVEAMGLKTLFSAFMGKSSKKSKTSAAMPASEDTSHILGVISSLSGITDREIAAEKKELLAQGEDPDSAEDLFSSGEWTADCLLYKHDVLLAWVIMEDDGAKQHAEMLLGRRGKSTKDIKTVLKGYLDNIGEAEPGEESPEAQASTAQREILNGLIGFLEGC
ncbi:beta-catenin-like protein 1 [Ceratobasidium sp. AG-Ba]|nr:beta-catenin-like protein 1 [Ceratobasidium sp. AG-Ba]